MTIGTTNANTPRDMVGEVANWTTRLNAIELSIQQNHRNVDVLFCGDSITEKFSAGTAEGLAIWNEFYVDEDRHVLNYGLAGDVTHGLLFRIYSPDGTYTTTRDHLEYIKPKIAVLMIGTNNFFSYIPNDSAADVAGGVIACAETIRANSPNTKVLICSILPRSNVAYDVPIDTANAAIAADPFVDGVDVQFIDLEALFRIGGTGAIIPELYTDGTHLTEAGYRVWAEAIEPILVAALTGPPRPRLVAAQVLAGTGTGIAGTQFDVTFDLEGETPFVYWMRMIGRTEQVDALGAGDTNGCYGFGVDASSLGSGHIGWMVRSVNPTQSDKTLRRDSVLSTLTTAGAIDGRLKVVGLFANGMRFEVVSAFAANYTFEVHALAGSDLEFASLAYWSLTTGTGALSIASLTHGADYVEHIWNVLDSYNATGAGAIAAIGKAYIPDGSNQVLTWSTDDNVATSNGRQYAIDTESGAAAFSSGPLGRFTTGPSLVNGFQVQRIESVGGTARPVISLVIKGNFRCKLVSGTTATSATTVPVDPTFIPKLTHLMSHCVAESTTDTVQDGVEFTVGSFLGQRGIGPGGAPQSCMGFRYNDAIAAGTQHVFTFVDINSVYLKLTSAGAIDGNMTVTTPSPLPLTAWTGDMTNPDPSPAHFMTVSFGEGPGPGRYVEDVVSFTVGTDIAGTTIDVTLPNLLRDGIVAKALKAQVTGSAAATFDTASASLLRCYGFAVSPTSRRCAGGFSENAAGPSNANGFWRNDSLIATSTSAGAVGGLLDVNVMTTPGTVQLIIDDAFPSAITVELKAIGGSQVTGAVIGDLQMTTVGTVDVAPGHVSRYVELLYPAVSSMNAIENSAHTLSLGRCWIPTLANHVLAYRANDNATPSNTMSYANDVEAIANLGSAGTVALRATISAGLPTGYRVNVIEAFAGFDTFKQASYLSLAGTFLGALGVFDTPADTVEYDPTFAQVGAEFWSHNLAESTTDTVQDGAQQSIGWATGQFGDAQVSMAFYDVDVQNPAAISTGISPVPADFFSYINLDAAGGFEGLGGLISGSPVSPTGSLFQMNTPDPATSRLMWAAFGESLAAGGGMSMALMSSARGYFFKRLRGKR